MTKPKEVSIKKSFYQRNLVDRAYPNGSNEYKQCVCFDLLSYKPYNCTTKSVTSRTIVRPPNLHIYKRKLKIKLFLSLVAYKNLWDEK